MPAHSETHTMHWQRVIALLLAPIAVNAQLAQPSAPRPANAAPSARAPATPQPIPWPDNADMDRARVARPFPNPERLGAEPLRAVPQIGSANEVNTPAATAFDIATLC